MQKSVVWNRAVWGGGGGGGGGVGGGAARKKKKKRKSIKQVPGVRDGRRDVAICFLMEKGGWRVRGDADGKEGARGGGFVRGMRGETGLARM